MLRIIIIIIIVIISFFLQSVSRLLLYSVSFFFSPLYLLTRHLPNLFHFLHISFVSSIHPPSHLSSSVAWRPLLLYQWAAAGSMSLSLCPFLSSLFLFFSPQTLLVSYFFPTFYVVEGFLLLGFFFCLFLACAQGYPILIQMHIFFSFSSSFQSVLLVVVFTIPIVLANHVYFFGYCTCTSYSIIFLLYLFPTYPEPPITLPFYLLHSTNSKIETLPQMTWTNHISHSSLPSSNWTNDINEKCFQFTKSPSLCSICVLMGLFLSSLLFINRMAEIAMLRFIHQIWTTCQEKNNEIMNREIMLLMKNAFNPQCLGKHINVITLHLSNVLLLLNSALKMQMLIKYVSLAVHELNDLYIESHTMWFCVFVLFLAFYARWCKNHLTLINTESCIEMAKYLQIRKCKDLHMSLGNCFVLMCVKM